MKEIHIYYEANRHGHREWHATYYALYLSGRGKTPTEAYANLRKWVKQKRRPRFDIPKVYKKAKK